MRLFGRQVTFREMATAATHHLGIACRSLRESGSHDLSSGMVRTWGPIHGASHNTYLFGVDDEDSEKVFLASSTIAQQWFAQSHKNARVISICTVGLLRIINDVDPTLLLRVRSGDSAKDFVFIVGFAGHEGGISFLKPEITFNSASPFGPEQRQEIYASMRGEKARLPKKTQDALNWL